MSNSSCGLLAAGCLLLAVAAACCCQCGCCSGCIYSLLQLQLQQ